MDGISKKLIEYLVVDTTAFIQNTPLQDVAENIITCPEVIAEITNKRQLRRLVVLPYNLIVKNVFPENINIVTDFAKKTGDYPNLSATDIKIMALSYQLEKEKIGTDHLRLEPVMQKSVVTTVDTVTDKIADVTGFFLPAKSRKDSNKGCNKREVGNFQVHVNLQEEPVVDKKFAEKFGHEEEKKVKEINKTDVLISEQHENTDEYETDDSEEDSGWITPANVQVAKKQTNSELTQERHVTVACMTTDFAMQNVLRQMNLNVSALDGRIIKQLRTYILRCYTCFKTTSIMSKKFCPKCGNNTLKRVAVSLNENGEMQIYINSKRPLTGRGKKFSLPRIKGGKHPNNPILVDDQPMPDNRPSRLARTKNNPLDDDYIAGFSPFVMRDVNSRSAQLCIRPGQELKCWMRRNPNETRRKRK